MPLYEYRCDDGHTTEELAPSFEESATSIQCTFCRRVAKRVISLPNMKLAWVPTVVDTAKEIWEGTPLEGTDGVNTVHYRSDKIFVDQGA